MRRTITLISAVALATGLLTGIAAADVDPVLVELQEAFDDAQAEVERLEGVVSDLEADLVLARQAFEDAIEDRDAKLLEVEELEAALALAEADLLVAQAAEATIRGLLAGLGNTYKDGECNNREGAKAACEQYLLDLAAAVADVAQKLAAVEGAEDDLEVAEDELVALEEAVVAARDEVERLESEIAVATEQLESAEQVRDDAQAALDAYVPPVAADAHAGCRGIGNAQQQVVKNGNGKGKAAEALATVAAKFDCAA
jgi:chromosome segregation ATPase